MGAQRTCAAVAAAAGLAISVLVVAGSAAAQPASAGTELAAASSPTQVTVIPPDPNPATTVPVDDILFAGTSGFLHRFSPSAGVSSGYLWTSYATGATSTVTALAHVSLGSFFPAGGDSIAIYPDTVGTPITELDLATGASTQYTAPAGDTASGLFGNAMIVDSTGSNPPDYSVLTFAPDGSYTSIPVTGLPAGAGLLAPFRVGDASDAVVRYDSSGGLNSYGLLSPVTGEFAAIPDSSASYAPVLSATSVAVQTSATTVDVFSLAGLTSGSDTTPQVVTLPAAAADRIALDGDYVVAVPSASGSPAIAAPVSGASPVTALQQTQDSTYAIAQAPDSALVVGGSGVSDWSVYQLSTDSGGSLETTAVLPLTQLDNAGLTISQGEVWHAEGTPNVGVPDDILFGHPLQSDNGFDQPYDHSPYDITLESPLPCAPDAACVRVVDGNWYGPAYLGGSGDQMQLWEGDQTDGDVIYPGPGTLVDASSDYAIVDDAASGSTPAEQLVVDVGYAKVVSSGPVTGAALWFDTLWQANAPGELEATDLTTMTAAKPIQTGSDCTATDVQAAARWIYWACGTTGPAGVYDLRTGTDISVPAGPALLGDGYVVQHDQATGQLLMYDVHTDTAAGPVVLASGVLSGPTADDRNITWAVDKYSGDVAYIDASDSVHVIDTGVPATPVAIGEPSAAELRSTSNEGSAGWAESLFLTRPVSGWTVTIRQAGTDKVVHTVSGGPARYGISPSWNDRLSGGAKAYSGRYTWTLTATAAGESSPTQIANYPFYVECGAVPFRSVDCDGEPALLAVAANSDAQWYDGTAAGGLRSNGYTENWALCAAGDRRSCVSALVPFGDFGGTGYADLLVRDRAGVLRAYLGIGQPDYNPGSVRSIRIGTGWDRYNALVAPGDESASGTLELLARDSAGRLWLYAATGHGKFRARKLISGGWGKYTRLIGAGDLTGNGIGDLLAVDASGTMWEYDGNGHGGFGARHRVSSGWAKYTAIIGIGDLTGDGDNDVVARGADGEMWLFPGNGHGGFGKRVSLHLNLRRYSLF